MPKHLVVTNPAPVLAKIARAVPLTDIPGRTIQRIIKHMSLALRASPDGIGIAAPQIGESLRIFLASEEALRFEEARELDEDRRNHRVWQYYVFINPVIMHYSRKKFRPMEGCLSVPGVFGHVERSEKVTIEAYNEHGKKFTRGASKLFAQLMQHEVDHLEGILFISKAKDLMNVKKEEKRLR